MIKHNSRNNTPSDEIPYIQDIFEGMKQYNFNDLIKPENNNKVFAITPSQSYSFDFSPDSSDPVAIAFNKAKETIIDRANRSEIITNFRTNENPSKEDRMAYEKELATITSEIYENIEISGKGKIFAKYRTYGVDSKSSYNARTGEYGKGETYENQPDNFTGPPTDFPVKEIINLNHTNMLTSNACTQMSIEEGWLIQSAENEILPKKPDDFTGENTYRFQSNYHLMGGMLDNSPSDNKRSADGHTYIMSEATASIIDATSSVGRNYYPQVDPNYSFTDAIAGIPSYVVNKGEYSLYGNNIIYKDIIAERREQYIQAKQNGEGLKNLATHNKSFSKSENNKLIKEFIDGADISSKTNGRLSREEQGFLKPINNVLENLKLTNEQNDIVTKILKATSDINPSVSDEDIENLGSLAAQFKVQGNDKVAEQLNDIAENTAEYRSH